MINTRNKAVIAMIVTAILWSSGGVLIKLTSANPLAIASGRSGLAAIFMLFYIGFKFIRISPKIFIGTLCYSFTTIGFVIANKLTTSANAIFLQFTATIWVVVFSLIFLKIRVRLSDIFSIIIIIGGMLLFFIDKMNSGMLFGNILAALTGISFAGFITNLKTIDQGNTIYPILYGNIINFFIGLPFYSSDLFIPQSIICLILLGFFQIGVSYILYSKAIEHLSAIDGIILPVIEPLLNPIWVFIAIGEKINRNSFLGGTIIILAVVVRNLYQTKAISSKAKLILK